MNPLIQLKKAIPPFGLSSPRAFNAFLACAVTACFMATETMLALLHPEVPAKVSNRTLTFTERVAHQRRIEEVYWRHRIWPKERLDACLRDSDLRRNWKRKLQIICSSPGAARLLATSATSMQLQLK
jgi:hypothetical protein